MYVCVGDIESVLRGYRRLRRRRPAVVCLFAKQVHCNAHETSDEPQIFVFRLIVLHALRFGPGAHLQQHRQVGDGALHNPRVPRSAGWTQAT